MQLWLRRADEVSAIVVSTEVERPASEVFAYATDPTRFSERQQGVVDGYMDQPDQSRPLTVGTRCLTTRHIGAAKRSVTSEITHIDPPRTWGIRGVDGPIRSTVDVTVEPLAETRSRLSIAVEFEGHGIGKILVPLIVNRQARNEMPGNLATLKHRVEAG
jgi:Polyketide cyclase / dehydrase and lipid transport